MEGCGLGMNDKSKQVEVGVVVGKDRREEGEEEENAGNKWGGVACGG